MSSKPPAHTKKIQFYIPERFYYIARAIADKNQEPLSALLKRLLVVQLEAAASDSFKASNFLNYAIKNGELSPEVTEEIKSFLSVHDPVPDDEV